MHRAVQDGYGHYIRWALLVPNGTEVERKSNTKVSVTGLRFVHSARSCSSAMILSEGESAMLVPSQ